MTADTGNHDDNLEPDRPDVTNGTHIVDVGLMQMEVGGVWNRNGVGQHSSSTPTTIRVGLSEWLEARISGDGFLSVTDASGSQHGIGNVQIGAKLQTLGRPRRRAGAVDPADRQPAGGERKQGARIGPGGFHDRGADRH